MGRPCATHTCSEGSMHGIQSSHLQPLCPPFLELTAITGFGGSLQDPGGQPAASEEVKGITKAVLVEKYKPNGGLKSKAAQLRHGHVSLGGLHKDEEANTPFKITKFTM